MRRLIAGALAAGLLWAAPGAALADGTDQVTSLCKDAPRGCSLSFDPWVREGVSYPVVVKGKPGARVTVVIYQARLVGDRVRKLTVISTGGEVTIPTSGVAAAQVTIPPLPDDLSGGWALVSLGGLQGTDTSQTIGGFVPLGSRIPVLLGDGYGTLKPAGAVLDLQLAGTIAGSRFAVDYQDEAGSWHDVTADTSAASVTSARPGDVATVRYLMPRGLAPRAYPFRLRNLTSGTAEVTWTATPDTAGVEAAVAAWGAPPAVGAQVSESSNAATRPSSMVKAVAAGVGGLALLIVLVAIPLAARRGRLA